MEKARIIIAGCRYFNKDEFVFSNMDFIVSKMNQSIEVLCGEATGVDQSGKRWAEKHSHAIDSFPANWKAFGNYAGPIRNEQMAKTATHCVCFWDGKSPGTANMIENAKKYNLLLRVINI